MGPAFAGVTVLLIFLTVNDDTGGRRRIII